MQLGCSCSFMPGGARGDRPARTGEGPWPDQPLEKIRFPFRAPVERLSYLVAVPGKRRSTSERPLLLSGQWRAIAPRERL